MESQTAPEPRCTTVAALISDGTSKIIHIHIATSHIGTSNHKRQWKSLMSTAFPNETKKVFLNYNDLKDQIQRLKLLKSSDRRDSIVKLLRTKIQINRLSKSIDMCRAWSISTTSKTGVTGRRRTSVLWNKNIVCWNERWSNNKSVNERGIGAKSWEDEDFGDGHLTQLCVYPTLELLCSGETSPREWILYPADSSNVRAFC